jgi:hypothetical protein
LGVGVAHRITKKTSQFDPSGLPFIPIFQSKGQIVCGGVKCEGLAASGLAFIFNHHGRRFHRPLPVIRHLSKDEEAHVKYGNCPAPWEINTSRVLNVFLGHAASRKLEKGSDRVLHSPPLSLSALLRNRAANSIDRDLNRFRAQPEFT